MERVIYNLAISEISDERTANHPFLTIIKFVFADDKPNGNNQAVDASEFDAIAQSSIGMPVKMHYTTEGAEDHAGSTPIGVIRKMEKVEENGINKLIAEAALWADEFPEEVQYLKDAFADGKSPGISWELGYAESILKDGIQWLKNVVARAATFVRKPAYGSRTQLLAIASLEEEERKEQILALAEHLIASQEPKTSSESKVEGGNNVDEKEKEELERLIAEAASKDALIADLQAKYDEQVQATNALTTEINSLKTAAVIENRTRRFVEAGFQLEAEAEKADKKKAVFASFTDEQFDEYLADLVAAKASGTPAPAAPINPAVAALQAANASGMPRVEFKETDLTDLKATARQLARPHSS